MTEQSHREEMSAAIRAQRERKAAPRSIAPEPQPAAQPEAEAPAAEPERKRLFGRLRSSSLSPMRRGLAWALTLPFVLLGTQAAHALAYELVYPQADMRVLLATGHGYLAYLPLALALAGAVALAALCVAAVDAARGRPARKLPAWAFALLPPAMFAAQEVLELSLRTGTFGWRALLAPTFLPGLALQLPIALAAYVAARLLLRTAERVGYAFRRSPPSAPPSSLSHRRCRVGGRSRRRRRGQLASAAARPRGVRSRNSDLGEQ